MSTTPLAVENVSKQFRQGDRAVAALAAPDGGRVIVNGQDLGWMNDRELTLFRRRNIGLVFQSFNLIPTLTAEENVALPLMLEGRNGAEARDKVDGLMASLG